MWRRMVLVLWLEQSVIDNVKEDGFGAMIGAVGRLERMKQGVIWQAIIELKKDDFLEKLESN